MEQAYAMVIESFGEALKKHLFDIPEPACGETRIRIVATGICGSDVHVWKGEDERSRLPMILGHEGIGFVDAVSGGKKDIFGHTLEPGDLVVWNRGVSCKSCYDCLIKRRFYSCKNRWSYGFSKSIHDYPYLNGSYASHMLLVPETDIACVIPADQVDPEADYVPYVSACCAGTTTACAFEQAGVESSDTVLIQGPGPLGIYAVLMAKESGASSIIVIGGTEERLQLCKEAGATFVLNRKNTTVEDRRKKIMEITGGRGADKVFELSGSAVAVEEGLPLTAVNGTYLSAGIAVDVGNVGINWFRHVVRKNIRIQGVWVGDMKNTWQAVKVYERHREILDRIITQRLPLEQATEALRIMQRRKAMKVALIP